MQRETSLLGVFTLVEQGAGELGLCVALAPSSAQAARSKQEGTACTELSYRDAGSHPNTEDLIPVIMQPHLVAFFFFF